MLIIQGLHVPNNHGSKKHEINALSGAQSTTAVYKKDNFQPSPTETNLPGPDKVLYMLNAIWNKQIASLLIFFT